MEKYFYVYYSYEEFGRGYIGKRECKCLPVQQEGNQSWASQKISS